MNQSQFLAVTCNSLESREESRVQGAIGESADLERRSHERSRHEGLFWKSIYNNVPVVNCKIFFVVVVFFALEILTPYCLYFTIRLRARVFYEKIVNEAQPSWLSLVENKGE